MKKNYRLKLTSPNLQSLLVFEKYLVFFDTYKLARLPIKRKKFVLQKSPFVQSKAKEHFQVITYKRLYCFSSSFFDLKRLLLVVPCDVVIRIEQDF